MTINNWLKNARGSIVILVGPSKKDLGVIEEWITKGGMGDGKGEGRGDGWGLGISFWVFCEGNPKKEINLEVFGVVLDLTT